MSEFLWRGGHTRSKSLQLNVIIYSDFQDPQPQLHKLKHAGDGKNPFGSLFLLGIEIDDEAGDGSHHEDDVEPLAQSLETLGPFFAVPAFN